MSRFDVRPAQTQRAEQRLVLEPRMLLSIEVLALPALELTAFLAEKALANEALVVEPDAGERAPGEEGEWKPRSVARERERAAEDPWEALGDRAPTVPERALEQVALLDLDPELDRWARFLVGCLDENGWLSATDAELLALAHRCGLEPSHDLLARGIALVQRLEPRGIGGRNAIEALLLQLDPADPDYGLSCRIVEECLDDLSRNKRPAVAKLLGIELVELERLVAGLAGLDPCPGRALAGEGSRTIHPDVVIERTETGFDVRVERSALPRVSVDPEVARAAADRTQSREVRAWLRERVEEARWLAAAVEDRRATLLRVARSAAVRQIGFLEHGEGHWVPLSLSSVAEELGLALSTVSRAVAEKDVATPHGIVPLRRFFQSPAGGDEGAAVEDVRAEIRALFAGEDPRAPLSDEEAVSKLRDKGVALSRRSLQKHRAALGIPSSYLRKKHG